VLHRIPARGPEAALILWGASLSWLSIGTGCHSADASAGPAFTTETFDAGTPDNEVEALVSDCGASPRCKVRCTGDCSLVLLASRQNGPVALAVDATHAYWTNNGAGTVMRAPLYGGLPATIASQQSGPQSIAVDSANLYWANLNQNGIWTSSGALMEWALGGGPIVTLVGPAAANGSQGQMGLTDIALGPFDLYWTTSSNGNLDGGTVDSVSLLGGVPRTLASQQTFPTSLATNRKGVYWLTQDAVVSLDLQGGTLTTLAKDQYLASGIAVDEAHVYWTVSGDGVSCRTGAVLSVPLSGGAATTLASEQGYPTGIAVDSESVYWTNQIEDGSVLKVPLAGGELTTLACGQANPGPIAVTTTSVCWADLGATGNPETGTVMRLTPK
jgi:hypothetical protein